MANKSGNLIRRFNKLSTAKKFVEQKKKSNPKSVYRVQKGTHTKYVVRKFSR